MRYLQQLSVLEQQAATEGRYVLKGFTSTQVETRLKITHFHGTMSSHLLERFKYLLNYRVRNSVLPCLSTSDKNFCTLSSVRCPLIVSLLSDSSRKKLILNICIKYMLITASFKFISPYKVRNEVEKEEGKEKNYSIDGYF